jgi:histidinol dehydrogenase
VLPTDKGAAFSSPLSVRDFGKFSSFIFPQDDETLPWEQFSQLAEIEGLYYHQRSLLARGGKEWPL